MRIELIIITIFVTALVLLGCKKAQPKEIENKAIEKKIEVTDKDSIITEKNRTHIYSTDIDKLSKVIHFKEYQPVRVDYYYLYIDNSAGRIPGPSDDFLEANLEFDVETMEEIRDILSHAEIATLGTSKKEFEFSWLDKETKEELLKEPERGGIEDILFGTNGQIWLLRNKILYKKR